MGIHYHHNKQMGRVPPRASQARSYWIAMQMPDMNGEPIEPDSPIARRAMSPSKFFEILRAANSQAPCATNKRKGTSFRPSTSAVSSGESGLRAAANWTVEIGVRNISAIVA